MILLRLLTAFIFSSLLSGCYLWGDYNSLKSDIRQLKAYLKAVPVPNECKPPGMPQSRICYYELEFKSFDKKRDLYVGHYTKDFVQQAQADCEATKTKIEAAGIKLDDDYKCLDPKSYRYVLYGFKIEGTPPSTAVGKFINIPHTDLLREGTKDEAVWIP